MRGCRKTAEYLILPRGRALYLLLRQRCSTGRYSGVTLIAPLFVRLNADTRTGPLVGAIFLRKRRVASLPSSAGRKERSWCY